MNFIESIVRFERKAVVTVLRTPLMTRIRGRCSKVELGALNHATHNLTTDYVFAVNGFRL